MLPPWWPPPLIGMQRARGTMQEVFRSVTEIKQRAEHSEAMVNGICRDIRALARRGPCPPSWMAGWRGKE